MGEDRANDDELLFEMLTSLNAEERERGWRIVLWRFGLPLKKYILALLNTRQMPSTLWEDIAQKTYSTAIELLADDKYSGPNLYPWLCRIARNHTGNLYRREQTHSRHTITWELPDNEIDEQVYPEQHLEYAPPEDIVLRRIHEQEQVRAYQQARTQLNADEKRLLDALLHYPERSIKQLADHLGENPKTVRNKKSLLLKKLKSLIDYFQQTAGGDSDD